MALVDGRQVNNEFLGAVLWDYLPMTLDTVDRIEVIRGPGSFLYGPNAKHGLVNIVTKSPLDYDGPALRISGGYGSYESSMASLMVVRRTEDAGVKATLGWEDIAQLDADPPPESVGNKRFLECRFEKRLADHHRFEVTGGNVQQTQEQLVSSMLLVPAEELLNEMNESYLKGNYVLHGLEAQVSWTGMDATSTPVQSYTPFELDLDTVDVDLQYSVVPWSGHNVTVGAGYRYATFETENQDIADGRHRTHLEWAFLQDEVTITRGVFVTASLRVDRHSVCGTSPSPRIAGVWKFDEKRDEKDNILREQSLRASAGYGFRNPSLRELRFAMPVTVPVPPGTVTILGNEDLEPEKIRSFELGYSGRPNERVKAGVGVYYNLIDDEIAYLPVSATAAAPRNENDEEAYGIETEVECLLTDSISGFANYSHGIRRNRDTYERIRRAPRNKANVGIRVSTPRRLAGMLWVNYVDEIEILGEAVDEYALLNGQVSYTFSVDRTETTVYVKALNMLNVVHREHPEAQRHGLMFMAGLSLLW
jgi:iron complex outermembrane receptor protein